MGKYLDSNGLSHLITKIKDYVDSHSGGGLSVNDIYPVGSIYMSVSSTDPGTLFTGTTWTRITDTFLLAAGTTYAADDGTHTTATGGAAEVTLTAAQSGVHAHGHGMTQPAFTLPNHVHSNTHAHNKNEVGDTASNLSGSNPTNMGNVLRAPGGGEASNYMTQNYTGNTGNPTTLPACTRSTNAAVSDHTGSDATAAHNNMPPYLPVYVWKRTA